MTFFRLLMLTVFFLTAATAEELEINGNFQSSGKENHTPRGWWPNLMGKPKSEVKMSISSADNNGIRSFDTETSEKILRFDTVNNLRIKVFPGDKLIFSGEAAGSKPCKVGVYAYRKRLLDEVYQPVGGTENFTAFRVEITIGKIKGTVPEEVVPIISYPPGGKFRVRNLKLDYRQADGQNALHAKYRFYPVYRFAKSPKTDTMTDAALWENIPSAGGFMLLKNDAVHQTRHQTEFQMAHDGEKLYLRILCREPNMNGIVTDAMLYQDGLRYDDQVEFAITNSRDVKQTYFVFNSLGAFYRANSSEHHPVRVRKEEDCWILHTAIPLQGLLPGGATLRFQTNYFFNIGRSNLAGGPLTHSSFAKGYGDRKRFAILSFHNETPPENVKELENEINRNYYEFQKETVQKCFACTDTEFRKKYAQFGTLDKGKIARYKALKKEVSALKIPSDYVAFLKRWELLELELRTARKNLTLQIDNPDAVLRLSVNGTVLPAKKETELSILEGVNILALETQPGKKVLIRLKGYPETTGKWRIDNSESPDASWQTTAFNDSTWPMAEKGTDGTIITGCRARQLLLWNRTHAGEERMLPRCREWLFSENSVDGMRITVYSPLSMPLEAYTVHFDFPENVRLLRFPEKSDDTSLAPVKVTESSENNGRKVYSLLYAKAENNKTQYSYLPILFSESKSLRRGMQFSIYYYRESGNFIELRQTLPARVLPPVNGQMPKQFSVVAGRMWRIHISDEYYAHLLQQLARSGFNTVKLPAWAADSTTMELQRHLMAQKIRSLGMKLWLGTTMYPVWGCHIFKGELFRYLKSVPEAQAERFDETIRFGKPDIWWNYMFCPSYVSTVGKEEFLRCVKEDLKHYVLSSDPSAEAIWINWEGFPWRKYPPYCFCSRCIRNFAAEFKIRNPEKLTRKMIREKYFREWEIFRTRLDGKVMALTTIAARELGKRMVLYSQTSQEDFWRGSAHSLDIVNPGEPGNGPGDSRLQAHMDYAAQLIGKATGTASIVGQQMLPFYTGKTEKGDYKKEFLASNSAFMEPMIFKMVFVRMAASLHGGILWYGILGAPVCGTHYYIGEASRLVSTYEPLFVYGKRDESLVHSGQIAYPNVLVLSRNNVAQTRKIGPSLIVRGGKQIRKVNERLVLLFNEGSTPHEVVIENKGIGAGAVAEIHGKNELIKRPQKMKLTIPPGDLCAVYIVWPVL